MCYTTAVTYGQSVIASVNKKKISKPNEYAINQKKNWTYSITMDKDFFFFYSFVDEFKRTLRIIDIS